MRYLTAVLCALTIAATSVPALAQTVPPTLTSSAPARLEVSTTPPVIDVYGDGFEPDGHEYMDEYMHWEVRRDDTAWQRCMGMRSVGAHDCAMTGWTSSEGDIQLGSFFTQRPGFVEFRLWHGLGMITDTEPAAGTGGWSNVLRVAVVPSTTVMQKVDPNSVRVMATPTPVATPVLTRSTAALSSSLSALSLPATTTPAKTVCSSTYVYQKAGGDALVENGAPVVLQRGTDVRVLAKPTGVWAAIVRGEHAPPAYVRASCLTSSS